MRQCYTTASLMTSAESQNAGPESEAAADNFFINISLSPRRNGRGRVVSSVYGVGRF